MSPPLANNPASDFSGGTFLVPVPRMDGDEGVPNTAAIATWHLALSNLVGVEIPHDLMGLWLFPDDGGSVLLAPEALSQDRILIAPPAPRLSQDQLYDLEQLLRTSGYESAIAVPIGDDTRDLGLLLLGDLQRGRYGPPQAVGLQQMAKALVQTFRRLAQSPPVLAGDPLAVGVTLETLPERLGVAATRAMTGSELVRLVSGIVQGVLPHDRLELVAGEPGGWHLLSAPAGRRRWGITQSDSGSTRQMTETLIDAIGDVRTLTISDLREMGGSVVWPTYLESREGRRIRSFLGARLHVADQTVGYLFLGGMSVDQFQGTDEPIAETIATSVAPRVQALHLALELGISRRSRDPGSPRVSDTTARIAEAIHLLATTAHWGDTLREFAGLARLLLPFDHLDFALRTGEAEGQLVVLEPGDTRPLTDLPRVTAHGTLRGAVASGAQSHGFEECEKWGTTLVLPLRIASRAIGVMRIGGIRSAGERSTVAVAQQFADLVAPHLEVLRREAFPVAAGVGRRT